jgi:hypothetical protein
MVTIGPFDYSHKITSTQSIELPFWIPIRSGEYKLPQNRKITIRNDFWLVSISNLVDGHLDRTNEFIVDEIQVSDNEYLERITEGNAQYYHKRKMKTTIVTDVRHIPPEGLITAEPGSESWKEQLHRMLRDAGRYMHNFLHDINQFIDYYQSLVCISNQATEVRRVSSFDTMVRVAVSVEIGDVRYSFPNVYAPDFRMANLPFPQYQVRDDQILVQFQDTLETLDAPSFHQIQWIRTLNHVREKRYQEALLSASLTLEALVYSSVENNGLPRETIKDSGGIAPWILGLEKPLSEYFTQFDRYPYKYQHWSKTTCQSVAKLWRLRNDVVHRQKTLSSQDHRPITDGIASLSHLRHYFLSSIIPELLELENQFSSFLEPVPFSEDLIEYPGQIVTVNYEWRREQDRYRKPFRPLNSEPSETEENCVGS